MGIENRIMVVGGGKSHVPLDTDETLGASSDDRVPSQRAVKVYADSLVSQANNVLTPGAGFAGTGTVYKSGIEKLGDLIKTTIFINLTGAKSSTVDLDIIGNSGVSHIGQITAAKNGTLIHGRITCIAAPVGGVTTIDVYSATEGTGEFDGIVTDLTETVMLTRASAWTAAIQTPVSFAGLPAANSFMYLTCGAAGTPGTYSAGQFMIELWGTA